MQRFTSWLTAACISLLLVLPWKDASAQCGVISTEVPSSHAALHQSPFFSARSGGIDSVGVALHILDPGHSPVPQILEIAAALREANTYFTGSGLHFFLCDINEINGRSSYSTEDIEELNKTYYIDHRINLYLVNKLTTQSNQFLCGIARFPWKNQPWERYMVVAFDCISDQHTLAHELGHYYGLLHTHEVSHGAELVNGSNCAEAGDLLCDTPADPGLGFHNVAQCQYSGSSQDALGDLYAPDPSLIMSYTPGVCATNFSYQQNVVIQRYALEVNNDLLNSCSPLPDFALSSTVKAFTTNFVPTETIPLTITGEFEGDPVLDLTYWISSDPGERGQLISKREVQLSQFESPQLYNFDFVIPPGRNDGLYYLTIKLDGDRKYREADEWNNQITIELTLVNASLDDVVLFPNPVSDIVNVFRRSAGIPGDVKIAVHDLSGRMIRSYTFDGDFVQFYVQLDLGFLEPGLYRLDMTSANRNAGFEQAFLFLKQ